MNETIGQRIKSVRKAYGLKQRDLAEILGCCTSNICGIEIGRQAPTAAAIKYICYRYNINEDWLRNGKPEMEEK